MTNAQAALIAASITGASGRYGGPVHIPQAEEYLKWLNGKDELVGLSQASSIAKRLVNDDRLQDS